MYLVTFLRTLLSTTVFNDNGTEIKMLKNDEKGEILKYKLKKKALLNFFPQPTQLHPLH